VFYRIEIPLNYSYLYQRVRGIFVNIWYDENIKLKIFTKNTTILFFYEDPKIIVTRKI